MRKWIQIKRIYAPYADHDGYRILVDRIWPRGIRKETAHIDLWLKDIAPSPKLRRWFGHEPQKWPIFVARYVEELSSHQQNLCGLLAAIQEETITLVFSARDEHHNQAVVLRDYVASRCEGHYVSGSEI